MTPPIGIRNPDARDGTDRYEVKIETNKTKQAALSTTDAIQTRSKRVSRIRLGISRKTMSLTSPSSQSVQAFVFGLENDSESHQRIPSDVVSEGVYLEGDEKRQSMYVELLDGT